MPQLRTSPAAPEGTAAGTTDARGQPATGVGAGNAPPGSDETASGDAAMVDELEAESAAAHAPALTPTYPAAAASIVGVATPVVSAEAVPVAGVAPDPAATPAVAGAVVPVIAGAATPAPEPAVAAAAVPAATATVAAAAVAAPVAHVAVDAHEVAPVVPAAPVPVAGAAAASAAAAVSAVGAEAAPAAAAAVPVVAAGGVTAAAAPVVPAAPVPVAGAAAAPAADVHVAVPVTAAAGPVSAVYSIVAATGAAADVAVTDVTTRRATQPSSETLASPRARTIEPAFMNTVWTDTAAAAPNSLSVSAVATATAAVPVVAAAPVRDHSADGGPETVAVPNASVIPASATLPCTTPKVVSPVCVTAPVVSPLLASATNFVATSAVSSLASPAAVLGSKTATPATVMEAAAATRRATEPVTGDFVTSLPVVTVPVLTTPRETESAPGTAASASNLLRPVTGSSATGTEADAVAHGAGTRGIAGTSAEPGGAVRDVVPLRANAATSPSDWVEVAPVSTDIAAGVAGAPLRRGRKSAVTSPRDGVDDLDEITRSRIATLLRALFEVQTTSDKSIMAFLGISHYLMTFSYIVGISSVTARNDFFDALSQAFEVPTTMKRFMEDAFGCGRGGLHVGGRTKSHKHVFGQPAGFRDDVLRSHINSNNAKVQWLSRRLSLRTSVNLQRAARTPTGALTPSDRDLITTSVALDGVSAKLRERGCTVRYASAGGTDKRALSLMFNWNADTTWVGGGLEAGLVEDMQGALLQGTPATHVDRDPSKIAAPKPPVRKSGLKRVEPDGRPAAVPPTKKRVQSLSVIPVADRADPCDKCGHAASGDVPDAVQRVSSDLEQWSADVVRSSVLPRGGHILAISLPMHMDCGPGGRVPVTAQITKTSSVQGPPYRYSVFISASPTPAQRMDVVEGAAYASSNGRPTPASAMSFDLLRAVSRFVAQRHSTSLPAATPDPGIRRGSVDHLQLIVRSAPRPAPLLDRFELASEYELSCQAELVERTPGRIVMFCEGIAPLPVQGAVTL